MRIWFASFALGAGLFCSVAHADTIYSLNLASNNGGVSGNGSFSLNVAPPSSGTATYTVGGKVNALDAFSVSIGGLTFDLSTTMSATTVTFTNGMLAGIKYGTSIGSTALQLNGLIYADQTIGTGLPASIGTVTAVPVVPTIAATPEPSGLILTGTGLLGVAGLARKRLFGLVSRN